MASKNKIATIIPDYFEKHSKPSDKLAKTELQDSAEDKNMFEIKQKITHLPVKSQQHRIDAR